jgi:hypothetical protein
MHAIVRLLKHLVACSVVNDLYVQPTGMYDLCSHVPHKVSCCEHGALRIEASRHDGRLSFLAEIHNTDITRGRVNALSCMLLTLCVFRSLPTTCFSLAMPVSLLYAF